MNNAHITIAEKIVEQVHCQGIECRSCPLYSGNFNCENFHGDFKEGFYSPQQVVAAREYLKFANHMKTIEKHIKEGKTKKRVNMNNIKCKRVKYLRKPNGKPYGCFVAYKINGNDELFLGYSLCHKDDTFKKKTALEIATSEINSATYNIWKDNYFDIPVSIFSDFMIFVEKQYALDKINDTKKFIVDTNDYDMLRKFNSQFL